MSRDNRHNGIRPLGSALAEILRDAAIPVPVNWGSDHSRPQDRPQDRTSSSPANDSRFARLRSQGWPQRALEHATSPTDLTQSLAAVRAWNPRESAIVLAGDKGAGKTVAAAWHALNDPASAVWRFVRGAQLVRFSRFSDDWRRVLEAPRLCIDDLGAEYADAKGSFISDLDELVDTFYADRRPLIVTTNLGGDEFRVRYGARIADRLIEAAAWVAVRDPSLRVAAPGVTPRVERMPWEDA